MNPHQLQVMEPELTMHYLPVAEVLVANIIHHHRTVELEVVFKQAVVALNSKAFQEQP
jgi:hypothetical protein